MDKLVMRNLVFYGRHGVLREEQLLGQRFVVSLELYLDVRRAALSDNVADTVDYAAVYDHVQRLVEGQPLRLIETVAERIAAHLLASFPNLLGVQVEVAKPQAPIPGSFDSVSCTVRRMRTALPD